VTNLRRRFVRAAAAAVVNSLFSDFLCTGSYEKQIGARKSISHSDTTKGNRSMFTLGPKRPGGRHSLPIAAARVARGVPNTSPAAIPSDRPAAISGDC
jgi:hypothetical protein